MCRNRGGNVCVCVCVCGCVQEVGQEEPDDRVSGSEKEMEREGDGWAVGDGGGTPEEERKGGRE